jgi:FkbM family methyltransferase
VISFTSLKHWASRPLRRAAVEILSRVRPNVEVSLGLDRLAIDLRDPLIARSVFLNQEFDSHVFEVLAELDLRGKTAVDVGANIGIYAVALNRLMGAGGHVFAYEPEARNYALLERNKELNNAASVRCINAAVGAAPGTCTLAINPHNWGDHWVTPDDQKPDWMGSQTIDRVKLDDQLAATADGQVAFVKIDVQGQELSVIRGMEQTVARNPDLVLFVEISPSHLRNAGTSATELVGHLTGLGFGGWELSSNRAIPMATPETYELMRGQYWADLLLCRNPAAIAGPVARYYGSQAG